MGIHGFKYKLKIPEFGVRDDLWILKVHDAAGIQIKGIIIQDSQIQKTSWHLLKTIMDSSAGTY